MNRHWSYTKHTSRLLRTSGTGPVKAGRMVTSVTHTAPYSNTTSQSDSTNRNWPFPKRWMTVTQKVLRMGTLLWPIKLYNCMIKPCNITTHTSPWCENSTTCILKPERCQTSETSTAARKSMKKQCLTMNNISASPRNCRWGFLCYFRALSFLQRWKLWPLSFQ